MREARSGFVPCVLAVSTILGGALAGLAAHEPQEQQPPTIRTRVTMLGSTMVKLKK